MTIGAALVSNVVLPVHVPHAVAAVPRPFDLVFGCAVPEDLLLHFVAVFNAVRDEAAKMVGVVLKHLVELGKRGKPAQQVPKRFALGHVLFLERENVVNVHAELGWQVLGVLDVDHEEDLVVPAHLENVLDHLVLDLLLLLGHAVVEHHQQRARRRVGHPRWRVCRDQLLPLHRACQGFQVQLVVNERVRDVFLVVLVHGLGRAKNDRRRDGVPFVVNDIEHQLRLARVALANKDTH